MRIAVMGTGAIGSYFGGSLARAGEDVAFIARGEQLLALQSSGLTLVEPGRSDTLTRITARADPRELGPVDVILLCVKLFDTVAALRDCEPLLGPETFIVTLQNGVESVATAARIVGPTRVVGGAVYVVVRRIEPGTVERTGDWARVEIAEPSGQASRRCSAFASSCRAAGIECEIRDDLERMIWSKFVLLAATSAMTALTRQPIGYVRDDPVALAVARRCMQEAVNVARAKGVDLPPQTLTRALSQLCHEMDSSAKASQLTDLESGRPLELDYLSGAIHRFGLELAVPTPVHSTVYAALKPFALGARADLKSEKAFA